MPNFWLARGTLETTLFPRLVAARIARTLRIAWSLQVGRL
jgi:hypothetical protein